MTHIAGLKTIIQQNNKLIDKLTVKDNNTSTKDDSRRGN